MRVWFGAGSLTFLNLYGVRGIVEESAPLVLENGKTKKQPKPLVLLKRALKKGKAAYTKAQKAEGFKVKLKQCRITI